MNSTGKRKPPAASGDDDQRVVSGQARETMQVARTTSDASASTAGVPVNHPQSPEVPECVEPPTSEATPVEQPDDAQLARMMHSAILMLGYAVADVERGLWTNAERQHLADGLGKLVQALRGAEAAPNQMIIDADRAAR